MDLRLYFMLSVFIGGTLAAKEYHQYQPEQIHLAFGDNTSEIIVTWSTFERTSESVVEYGINGMILSETGESTLFVDGGKKKHSQYIHRVRLTNLQPSQKYVYHCGSSKEGWSSEFWFKTVPEGENWSPSVVIFGDMGNENAQSLTRLQEEGQREMYDAAIHVGDFAYDMDSDEALVGDAFMNQIQSFAGYLPYMVCPGNHEEKYNFSNYRNRFSMPGIKDNMMYSFNLGPVHFISVSTEYYYFLMYGIKSMVLQYEWLVADLTEANKPENRKKHPWIIVFGHRPMYCSNSKLYKDCTHHETMTRVGIPILHKFGLEELFYKHGVDLEIWAHEHSYERMWPLYDYNVYNGSLEEPYTNPGAPIHFTTGSAGCKEGREPFVPTPPEWSAFRSQDYGYTRMKVHNSSHLYIEQVSDDMDGAVIDQFWIIKDKHGPYLDRPHLGRRPYPHHEL